MQVRNVHLCPSEIDYLGRKFITYLAAGHRQAVPRIGQAMKFNGGYILHLDAAHDSDAPALMTGMDGLSKIVLANVKLPSENADYIVPFLQKLKADYGTQRACVHDTGAGIFKAVGQVFPGIPDFICHFHFLRDIGKDCLEPVYQKIHQRLRYHATSSRLHEIVREARRCHIEQSCDPALPAIAIIDAVVPEDGELMPLASAYALTLWSLHGKRAGDGYGFPFDRALLEFVDRLLTLNRIMPELREKFSLKGQKDNQILQSLAREVSCIGSDVHLLGKAILLIQCDPARVWTVASLADEVAMSRSAFPARFKELVGESPMQYITCWRMNVALTWLKKEDVSLGEIANRLGYQSEAAFSRSFKRFIGVSPGAARQNGHIANKKRA